MARRIFIEPNIFLNPSLRVMPTLYKTLWLYLLTSCDEVGVWVVDWEMAGLACGGKIDTDEAARLFLTTEDLSAKPKAIPIHGGRRWFIRSYLDFQYSKGILNNSQWAKSLQKMLEKHGIDFETLEPISNPLPNPLHNPLSNPLPKGIGQDRIGQDKDMEVVSTALSYQGGAGGNGNYFDNIFPEFLIAFCAAYEKTGKRGAVEQAARDAVRTIDGNPSDAMIQLCQQAQDYVAWYRKSNPKDPPLKFMPEPQTWLIQSMYAEDWKFKLQQLNKKSTGGKLPRFLENPNP